MANPLDQIDDQRLLRQTADLYAVGADRRDKTLWQRVLAQDCVIAGPGFETRGRDACLQSIDDIGQMYRATRHDVSHQLVAIDGDSATGETYCTASHLLQDRDALLIWAIRYQDSWRREGEVWHFVRRTLLLDWSETRPVTVGNPTT